MSEFADVDCVCSRRQVTPQHTHPQTVGGMKPRVAQRAVRRQGRRRAPACGTPLPVTLQPGPPPPAGTRRDMPRPATAAPREACGRTAGTKRPKRSERRRDTGAAGRKRRAQTGTSRWARLPPREPARGSLAGTKRLPVKWDRRRLCSPQGKLRSEHQR